MFRSLKVEYPINVQIQNVVLNDSIFSIGLLFQEDKDIYTVIEKEVRPSTYVDDDLGKLSGSVIFKLDLNRTLIQRIVYTFLDYLGDIGGLFGTFTGLATTFSLILNFNGVYHKLTSLLFKVQNMNISASQQQQSQSQTGAENSGLANLFARRIAGQLET